MLEQHYPFTLPPLPCAYNALEPYIDTETMRIHHDIMFKKYVDNLNMILKDNPIYQDWSLHNLLAYSSDFEDLMETALKNNGGGVMNHYMYFDGMTPNKTEPSQNLRTAIIRDFGSMQRLCQVMKTVAISQFGSGYARYGRPVRGGAVRSVVPLPHDRQRRPQRGARSHRERQRQLLLRTRRLHGDGRGGRTPFYRTVRRRQCLRYALHARHALFAQRRGRSGAGRYAHGLHDPPRELYGRCARYAHDRVPQLLDEGRLRTLARRPLSGGAASPAHRADQGEASRAVWCRR